MTISWKLFKKCSWHWSMCITFTLHTRVYKIWINRNVETKVWFVPLHSLITRLDQNIGDVLLKAHILTGWDVISKIWTKSEVLESATYVYLKHFDENKLLESSSIDAEIYFIKDFKSTVQVQHSMNYDVNSIARKTKSCMTSHLRHDLFKNI